MTEKIKCPYCEKEMDYFEEEETPYGMLTRYLCRKCAVFVDIQGIGEDEMKELLINMGE